MATQIALVNLTGDAEAEWMRALKEVPNLHVQTLPGLNELQLALEERDGTHGVIVYSDPAEVVARALKSGRAPAQALVEWQEFGESLVKLHHRAWAQLTVVDAAMTSDGLRALAIHLGEKTGAIFETLEGASAGVKPSSPAKTDPGLYLAAQQLLSMRRARSLIGVLEAMTVAAPEGVYTPDVVSAFLEAEKSRDQETDALKRRVQEGDALRTKAQKLAEIQQENSMVIGQLHRTQEQLERYIRRDQEKNEKIQGLRRGRDYRKTRIAELEKSLGQREQKIEWLRAERERREERIKSLDARMKDLEMTLKRTRDEVNAMKNSRSWKYTKFLRRLNGTES